MSVITAKEGNNAALRYGAWAPIPLGAFALAASQAATKVWTITPLALNYKIMAVSYCITSAPGGNAFTAGYMALNVVQGNASYEGAAAASSYAYVTLGGTFAGTAANPDQITFTLAGVAYTVNVNLRDVGSLQKVAAAVAASLNNDTSLGFNALYRANSLGAIIMIQTLAYATATPTFVVSTTSAAGTVTASAGIMTAGVAGTLPTQPIHDQSFAGTTPTPTAVAGNALFPADLVLPTVVSGQEALAGVIYCSENFDAVWPAASALTVRVLTGAGVSGDMSITLWGVPEDIHSYLPATLPAGFRLTQDIL